MAFGKVQIRVVVFVAFCLAEAILIAGGLRLSQEPRPDAIHFATISLILIWFPFFLAYLLWQDRFRRQALSYFVIAAPAAAIVLAWGAADRGRLLLAWVAVGFGFLQYITFMFALFRKLTSQRQELNRERVETEENPLGPVATWALLLVLSVGFEAFVYIHAVHPLAWWAVPLICAPSLGCAVQLVINLRDRWASVPRGSQDEKESNP